MTPTVAAAMWSRLIDPAPPGASAWPGLSAHLFTEGDLDRLAAHATVLQPFPLDLARTDPAVLEPVEVLLASWGTPRLGTGLLDRLPNLRFVSYAAGTVKPVVTDEMWDRGVRVSSAAAAGAVPVAEFTVAAIVMIAKDVFRLASQLRISRGSEPIEGVGPGRPLGNVFSWGNGGYEDRLPLSSGAPLWRPVLDCVAEIASFDGSDRFALLEHIEDDDPAHLRRDAHTLRAWIDSLPAREPER